MFSAAGFGIQDRIENEKTTRRMRQEYISHAFLISMQNASLERLQKIGMVECPLRDTRNV